MALNSKCASTLIVMDERERLLAQAQRCRRIAEKINDAEAAEAIRRLAEEYEQRAKAVENKTT